MCADEVAVIQLLTADGQTLEADLAEAVGERRGSVVLCHPHPQYGGNRFHPLTAALFELLPTAGFTTIRFDFRADHDAGIGEQLDIVAALDVVDDAGLPMYVVGYSFGAIVGLSVDDERIDGLVAVAPPLADARDPRPRPIPTLLLSPRHDQFCPGERAVEIAGTWTNTTVAAVESTDHFLHGKIADIARRATDWLAASATE